MEGSFCHPATPHSTVQCVDCPGDHSLHPDLQIIPSNQHNAQDASHTGRTTLGAGWHWRSPGPGSCTVLPAEAPYLHTHLPLSFNSPGAVRPREKCLKSTDVQPKELSFWTVLTGNCFEARQTANAEAIETRKGPAVTFRLLHLLTVFLSRKRPYEAGTCSTRGHIKAK